jgi:peptidyl-prolyl cis-trans isomerase C
MKITINKNGSFLIILIAFVFIASCGNSEEKKINAQNQAVSTNQVQSAAPAPVASVPPAANAKQPDMNDVAISVDGNILKKSELEKNLKERLNTFKDKIPADKIKETQANMKKQMMDEFVMRNLMINEVQKRKVEATDKEIKMTTDQIKASLPPGKTLDAFLKENKISREDIVLGIKVKKLVMQELGKKAKPSQKEISKFYNDNKDKFIVPENVHVRHILVAFVEGDDDKVKAEKKVKIENLRKQVVDGADFAEVARKNSDCPSKDSGGDLGLIGKGQTVKPFEDAAFSQEIKAIGPVVATEYGYHIIQVLEHNSQKTVTLEEAKSKIVPYLEQQKQSETFNALVKKLRENAKIIVYEN